LTEISVPTAHRSPVLEGDVIPLAPVTHESNWLPCQDWWRYEAASQLLDVSDFRRTRLSIDTARGVDTSVFFPKGHVMTGTWRFSNLAIALSMQMECSRSDKIGPV
jgi:hypothetical protein